MPPRSDHKAFGGSGASLHCAGEGGRPPGNFSARLWGAPRAAAPAGAASSSSPRAPAGRGGEGSGVAAGAQRLILIIAYK